MADREFDDPAASTEMFRAFVEDGRAEGPASATNSRLLRIGALIVVVLALAVIAWWILWR